MEKMPFQPEKAASWREGLPVLEGAFVTLREARAEMAQPLWAALWPAELVHLFAPVPTREEDLMMSLAALAGSRASGSALAFAVETTKPIGLIQVASLEPGFQTAEWAFAFAPDVWPTHAAIEALTLARDFVLETLGAHRIEARTFVDTDLRIASLRQLGAVEEGRLRASARVDGRFVDQRLWAIVKGDRIN